MRYRLISHTYAADEPAEIVFVQLMNDFDAEYPATIEIVGYVKSGGPLAEAVLSDEFDLEFGRDEIETIGGAPLADSFEAEKELRVEFKFVEPVDPELMALRK
jgi:hypothetical protein